ncbi:MAG: helix-turn-helix domain-containing protein [Thermodesulfobacteriota bacterium]
MKTEAEYLEGFRKRFLKLVNDQFKGRHTSLARKAGVPPTTLQDWKDSKSFKPNGFILARIAEVCNISIDWLLTGREPPDQKVIPFRDEPSAEVRELLGLTREVFESGFKDITQALELNIRVFHKNVQERRAGQKKRKVAGDQDAPPQPPPATAVGDD